MSALLKIKCKPFCCKKRPFLGQERMSLQNCHRRPQKGSAYTNTRPKPRETSWNNVQRQVPNTVTFFISSWIRGNIPQPSNNNTLFESQIILAEHECCTNWGDCKSNKSNQIKCWFLRRGENRSSRRKTSRSRVENQQTQPTYDAGSGNRTRDTLVEGERSHHYAKPCSPSIQKLVLREFASILSRERYNGSWYKVQVSKRKPHKTLRLYQNLSAFLRKSNVSQFCCQKQPLKEKETVKDKFGKLPLKNSKSRPNANPRSMLH